jgi:hypothetical protein
MIGTIKTNTTQGPWRPRQAQLVSVAILLTFTGISGKLSCDTSPGNRIGVFFSIQF